MNELISPILPSGSIPYIILTVGPQHQLQQSSSFPRRIHSDHLAVRSTITEHVIPPAAFSTVLQCFSRLPLQCSIRVGRATGSPSCSEDFLTLAICPYTHSFFGARNAKGHLAASNLAVTTVCPPLTVFADRLARSIRRSSR